MAEHSSTNSICEEQGSTKGQRNEVETQEGGETFNYDDILEHVGQLGQYQLHTFLWLCVPAFFPGIVVMSYTFTGGVPGYRCFIEGCDADVASHPNNFDTPWLNNTIPWTVDDTPDQCNRYNYTWTSLEECQQPGTPIDPEMIAECDNWIYDTSLFESTIVTEFDLTCENEWKQVLASSVYMFGMLIGAALLGNVADKIGRQLAFSLNAVLLATVTTSLAFSPNFAIFCVLRFLCGVSATGHFLILFVWGVEAVGKKYRVMCGFIYQSVFTVGSAILGLIAFYIRDWKTLQLVISVPMFALACLYWVVPESIRWLITEKRYSEARLLILEAARINKKTVPNHLIFFEKEKHGNTGGHVQEAVPIPIIPKGESIIDVFRSVVLMKRLVIMFCAWIAAVMGYYGITFSATNLSDDFFLNYELAMVVEFPAYIGGIFVMDKLGRRPTLSGGLIISGVACLITGLVPEDPPAIRIAFSMIGKLFISCVMATVYSYTSDLFPTPARSAAVGICSTTGRVGGILAPIIASAGRKIDPALPFIVFACVNISVGLLALLLPETSKTTLPDTIKEAEEMEQYTFSCLQRSKNRKKESVSSSNSLP